jgi:uncharacterized caspase-like protein
MLRVFIVLLFSISLSGAALADRRVALVIGNSAYEHTPRLTNPSNDATDIAVVLKALGIQVIEGFDLDKASFDRKVRDFADALSGAKVGIFFYAGHGLQVAGANYLVPVDAKLSTSSALDWEMVRLDLVQRTMERETETNVLFLDACRDNPLARNLARAMGTRSAEIGRGLASAEAGVGTLISFSTQPGNVALDGSGRNSPFAGALVKRISASNEDLSALLIEVRNDVRKATLKRQVPWEHSALTGKFYFSSMSPSKAPLSTTADANQVVAAWDRTKDTTNIEVLEAFASRYSGTYYAQLATLKIEELRKQQVAAASPPRLSPPSTERSAHFDGNWLTKITCPGTAGGASGYSRQFVGRVSNRVFHGEDGIKNRPLWMVVDGLIEPDGRASLSVRGLTGGDRNTSLGKPAAGAHFSWTVTAHFKEKQGTGKRDAGRRCDFTFTKQ